MIKVEGYKAFKGVLKIEPKNNVISPFCLEGEFLYRPDTDCWYGCGRSFAAQICEVVKDDEK